MIEMQTILLFKLAFNVHKMSNAQILFKFFFKHKFSGYCPLPLSFPWFLDIFMSFRFGWTVPLNFWERMEQSKLLIEKYWRA